MGRRPQLCASNMIWRRSLTPGATWRSAGSSKAARGGTGQWHTDTSVGVKALYSEAWGGKAGAPRCLLSSTGQRWKRSEGLEDGNLQSPPRPAAAAVGSDSDSHHPDQQSNAWFVWSVITAGRPPTNGAASQLMQSTPYLAGLPVAKRQKWSRDRDLKKASGSCWAGFFDTDQ